MTTITNVELRRVDLPFVTPFRTSFGVQHVRQAIVVRVLGDDVEGWGEVVCGVDPLYSSEYVDGAWDVLARYLAPAVLGRPLRDVDVAAATAAIQGHRMAKAGLEMAVLDARLRATGTSMKDHLGGTRDVVPVGVSVGIADDHAQLLERIDQRLEEGYGRVKLKIEPGWDVDMVAAVRAHVGDDVALQVDANTAYRRSDLDHLVALDEFGLVLVEQPLPAHDLLGHADLARRMTTPICLDESITSAAVTRDALDLAAASIVNIKPGRVGGLLESRRIHDLCRARDVPVWCGGMLETGIGRAANLALASLPGFTLPGDISSSARYFHQDITPPFVAHDGMMAVPTGAGLGVEVDRSALEAATARTEQVSR
ncbi:MAG TPA: o-succinylbenzoate synthase [Nitriliruptoraceae bacterium]|nr:o-succinylbenzoate synthase [Nitriliruptoraceae bacterium]